MILVNVLLIVALAAGILAMMISSQDVAIERSTRLRAASQAEADAEGGILSAIVALRRDAATTPGNDNRAQSWAKIGERGAAIRGGRFQLAVADAQGRFNINTLAPGGSGSRALFAQVAVAAGLRPAGIAAIETLLATTGPLADIGDLRAAGLSAEELAALEPMITALPSIATQLNANAMDEPLLALALSNAGAARLLLDERLRFGFLTSESFARARVLAPPGVGFSSNFYWARARVSIGDASQQLTALLERKATRSGIQVVPVGRWRGPSPPPDAPPLPEIDA